MNEELALKILLVNYTLREMNTSSGIIDKTIEVL